MIKRKVRKKRKIIIEIFYKTKRRFEMKRKLKLKENGKGKEH